jgi:hypothetical protein
MKWVSQSLFKGVNWPERKSDNLSRTMSDLLKLEVFPNSEQPALTSKKEHRFSMQAIKRLMLFTEIIGVYYDKCMKTVKRHCEII